MSKNGFNDEQNQALENPIDINLLISAGAGSGKTKTLSEKVMLLIEQGLKPSELLVLTFTNNAAHEMKGRIISKFIDRKDIAYELTSAHIQTFDSFSQYLVSSYSNRLKIAEQFSIINEDVLNTKKKEFLDQVFDEYYSKNYQKLFKTLVKFNLRDDKQSKAIVYDLVEQIEKLNKEEKDILLNHYEEYYLSKEFFNSNIHELVKEAKDIIKNNIYYAYFIEKHFEEIDEVDINKLEKTFSNKNNFEIDLNIISFIDEKITYPLFIKLRELLSLDDYDFIDKVKSFQEDNKTLLPKTLSKKDYDDKKAMVAYPLLKELVTTVNAKLKFIQNLDELDNEYNKILYFKDDISLYLEMAKKVLKKIEDYKRITNSYTFFDISNMALSLMVDEEYEDIAEEIRSRFKFIMVDEYQDTNDMQEAFINSLLKVNKKSERSHLFCVGDAKQSIYAFRGSNVELFRNRQEKYIKEDGSKALPMNKNYRSGKRLLLDINSIFDYYMTLNHGSISYSKFSESLQYDDEINLYNIPYEHFGVHRITSISSINNDNYPDGAKIWEARAIASDIKNKVKNQFLISERTSKGNVTRPAKYKDFCILVSKKSSVDIYQKVFQEFGIKLNCSIKNNLNEIDAITLIQSLLSLMNYLLEDKLTDPYAAHLFASIARSYIYEYSDQKLFDLLYDTSEPKQYFLMNNDPIMNDLTNFVNNHLSTPFSKTFLDLIDEFKIIEKLYKIGNVDDTISKIESLYQIALSEERSGEGIKEFIRLMDNIKKYDLDLSSESLYQVEDAVDLMTIHASKGLEKKIIYMPVSYNSINKGDTRNKPDYTFSKKLGILLPYYNYHFSNLPLEDALKENFSKFTINDLLYHQLDEEKKIIKDEHVRLFYVALTRAENMVFIVGDLKDIKDNNIKVERNSDSLYGMLSYMPYYPQLNEQYINNMIKLGVISNDDYNSYLTYVSYMKNIKKSLTNDDLSSEDYDRYYYLWREYYQNKIYKKIIDIVNKIERDLFNYYYPKFININDYDELAKLFASYFYHDDNAKNINDLINHKSNNNDDNEEEDNDINIIVNKDNVIELLDRFKEVITTGQGVDFLNIKITKSLESSMFNDEYPSTPIGLTPYLINLFAKYFDNVATIKYLSFKRNDYEDKVYRYDYRKDLNNKIDKKITDLKPLNIDDSKIIFDTKIHQKASKSTINEEDLPIQEVLDYGTYLHRLMELTDFINKDTSFIKNSNDRKIIDEVMKLDIFKDLSSSTIYKEYGYYDDNLLTNGFIDLLIKKDDKYIIVDYKAKHILDDAYINQLHIYRDNVSRLFNVTKDNIEMYLLSLIDHKLLKVD